jgi:hypothetical protein
MLVLRDGGVLKLTGMARHIPELVPHVSLELMFVDVHLHVPVFVSSSMHKSSCYYKHVSLVQHLPHGAMPTYYCFGGVLFTPMTYGATNG